MQRNQIAAVGFAAVLFAIGAAAGVLGHRYYTAASVNAASPDAARHHYLEETRDRLKLTPAQTSQLETIMHETKAKMHAVRDTIQPEMLRIKQEHIERVRSILRPDQIPAYEKLVAEREQRSREQEEREHASEHPQPRPGQ